MMKATAISLLLVAASPALAGGSRHLDAHEHGVSELDIAMEGTVLTMELRAPGADIVGFEHAASSAGDRAAIEAAVAQLAAPLELFVLPEQAACSVLSADAEIEGGQGGAERHSAFHAEYRLECARPEAIDAIDFAFFAHFGFAREIEVQVVTGDGARAFEVTRDAPRLALKGLLGS
jgi:hypothetical protein